MLSHKRWEWLDVRAGAWSHTGVHPGMGMARDGRRTHHETAGEHNTCVDNGESVKRVYRKFTYFLPCRAERTVYTITPKIDSRPSGVHSSNVHAYTPLYHIGHVALICHHTCRVSYQTPAARNVRSLFFSDHGRYSFCLYISW